MELSYTYWQDGVWYVGFLYGFPDYWTQGENIAELEIMIYVAGNMSLNSLSDSLPDVLYHGTLTLSISQTNLSIHGGIYGYYQNR